MTFNTTLSVWHGRKTSWSWRMRLLAGASHTPQSSWSAWVSSVMSGGASSWPAGRKQIKWREVNFRGPPSWSLLIVPFNRNWDNRCHCVVLTVVNVNVFSESWLRSWQMPEQLYRDRRERRKEPSRTCCWRERSFPDTCSTHTGDTISDTKLMNYIGHIKNQDINCNFYIYETQR